MRCYIVHVGIHYCLGHCLGHCNAIYAIITKLEALKAFPASSVLTFQLSELPYASLYLEKRLLTAIGKLGLKSQMNNLLFWMYPFTGLDYWTDLCFLEKFLYTPWVSSLIV